MVLIRRAMKQHMMYRLYAVWLLASWAYAVHSIMVGLVPKAAVMLAQHGCATAQLKQVYNGKAKDPLESLVQSGPGTAKGALGSSSKSIRK